MKPLLSGGGRLLEPHTLTSVINAIHHERLSAAQRRTLIGLLLRSLGVRRAALACATPGDDPV